MDAEKVHDSLKYCPLCAQDLVINPLTNRKSCFLDGDFNVKDNKLIWQPIGVRPFQR